MSHTLSRRQLTLCWLKWWFNSWKCWTWIWNTWMNEWMNVGVYRPGNYKGHIQTPLSRLHLGGDSNLGPPGRRSRALPQSYIPALLKYLSLNYDDVGSDAKVFFFYLYILKMVKTVETNGSNFFFRTWGTMIGRHRRLLAHAQKAMYSFLLCSLDIFPKCYWL